MKSYPVMPGVPAAGHVTTGGAWHPGAEIVCGKCHPRVVKARCVPDCDYMKTRRHEEGCEVVTP